MARTAHPSAAWTLQQLREVVGFDRARRYLIHDRDSISYTCYACFIASLGRLDQALEINLKGTRRDPLSAHTWFRRSIQLNAAGRYAEARAAANRALEILAAMPGHILGRVIDQVARAIRLPRRTACGRPPPSEPENAIDD